MALLKLRVASGPLKAAVAISVPLADKLIDVIPVGGVPVSERVILVSVTGLPLGLFTWICWMGTPEAPGIWMELPGGLNPCEAETVTGVGLKVGVTDAVEVAV